MGAIDDGERVLFLGGKIAEVQRPRLREDITFEEARRTLLRSGYDILPTPEIVKQLLLANIQEPVAVARLETACRAVRHMVVKEPVPNEIRLPIWTNPTAKWDDHALDATPAERKFMLSARIGDRFYLYTELVK